MTKYRTRLLIAMVLLIVGVLLGLGILLGQLFKNYYLDSFYERLEKESSLIRMYIEDYGGLAAASREELGKFSKQLGAGIILTDKRGDVLYNSKGSMDKPVDLMAEMTSGTKKRIFKIGDGQEVHYYWTEIEKDGQLEGYLFLSLTSGQIKDAYKNIWWLLFISLGLAWAIIVLISLRIIGRYAKPIESAANVALELAKGNYRARTYETDRRDETGLLSTSINTLARNLEELEKTRDVQQERLSALIENIGSGLVLIDSRGYINLINKGYKELLDIDSDDILDKPYYEAIPFLEVREMVEEIFMTEQKQRKQLILPVSAKRKYFDVSTLPIIGTNNVWKGVLLVIHDITELKKLEQVRKDFVANVSHELKTPVTSIKGFAETLLDGAMKDEEALKDFLTIILKESDRLQRLIQDLLELSKLEQQSFRLDITNFNLAAILQDIVKILEGKAAKKTINLEYKSNTDILEMEGDSFRLRQVIINLLINAIAYTPVGGQVILTMKDTGKRIRVSVKDTGIGIEKTELPRIFERFYRVDKARSRNSGGTGLGLAIVKHIVEAHRGKIKVKSQPGVGTEFILEFRKTFRGKPKNS
ncbi:PAS domain-containing protein [Neobacillus notoginsengisoli]|uniref:histidine kinase n=1 Tax=Neobacillus notoginsengisoli TaxID=1578198 RepID=A0A417YU57_9BACI|nr:ATP-binding protein [Neobacillus notoginsengisoli]RHW40717.1 PAS domain-containing protein [Neobacillus notoginsengisoli]